MTGALLFWAATAKGSAGWHNGTMSNDDGLDRATSKDFGSLRGALTFLAPYKLQVVVASLALIVTAGVTLSMGQGMRIVIDRGFSEGSSEMLAQSLMVFTGLVVLLTVGTFVRFYYVSWVGERVSADIRLAVFNHLIRLHPGFFEKNSPTEIQSRITTDTTLLQTVIGSSVSIALRNMLMFVGGLILLFVTNVKLSLIVLASVPLVVLPLIAFGRRVRSLSRTSQDRLATVGTQVGESLRQIKIVQAFNHETEDERLFAERVESAFSVSVRRVAQRAWLVGAVMLLVFGAIAVMLWVGGQDVLSGNTSAGELAAFIFYAFIVAGSVGAISEVYADLQRAAGATERLVELLRAPNELPVEQPATVLSVDAPCRLEVQDVKFAYPLRPDMPVLQGLSFVLEPGEMVALVGTSGAGKSTLFDLLQRFYDPSSGSIALDGHELTQVDLNSLRSRIGFVPQDPVLFAGTLRDNLAYADPQASELDLRRALQLSNAAEFVDALPQGLDTPLAEAGVGLSGGQRQRLAIARALVGSPKVLLLDEATSALDAQSESRIRESILGLKGSCSMLVIAHRLSTVREADRIMVLADGVIQGMGTHNELMADNELYAHFARIQFADGATPETPVDSAAS